VAVEEHDALAPIHNVGNSSTLSVSFFSAPSATAVHKMVSVKVGRWWLCCSQAAMGASTTVLSRGT
jgi:hypothetical protein